MSQIITFGTMAAKMVIRDVARVLDVPYLEADSLAKMIPNELHITIKKSLEQNKELRDRYETDETVNKKIKSAFKYGLKPIVCVGETIEQREAGKAVDIITNQTRLALEGLTDEQVQNTIIAYEPIWAIGTGKTATSEDANNSIKAIRQEICQIYGQNVANGVIIQYGGSVKSSNAKELFEMSDIDGGLVGGASLKSEEFSKIVNYDK